MDKVDDQGAGAKSPQVGVFKYIELLLQWQGKLNARDIVSQLGMSRQSASKAITSYRNLYPGALNYNSKDKKYQPTEQFSPECSAGGFQEYMSLFHGESSDLFPASYLPGTHQEPLPDVVRPIINAIENNLRLDVSYASISSPEFEERIISPHSLIHDGNRWHVRAWCEKNHDFRDFVLTRIKEVFACEGVATMGREADSGWNTVLDLSIEPDSRLSEARRNIVAMDYGMEPDDAGKFSRNYQVRGAMVMYWLQRLRLDRYSERPEAQQVVLSEESRIEVKKWTS